MTCDERASVKKIKINEELVFRNGLKSSNKELRDSNEKLKNANLELNIRNQKIVEINEDLVKHLTSTEVPIIILDLSRRIKSFTPKAQNFMNLLPSDVGRPICFITPKITVENLDQEIQGVMKTLTIRESEVQDRENRWHKLQIRPYMTADSNLAGTIVSLLDIEELRDETKCANDLFLATLSHELRTPLTTLLLQAQLLLYVGSSDPRVIRAGVLIERAARSQAQVIDDLFDISKIVAGKFKMAHNIVSLNSVIQDALLAVAASAKIKSIIIESNLSKSAGEVSGDADRLQQIVWNLLVNAIKFGSEGDKVTIELNALDGFAQIKVSDHGIGIAPDFLPFIFSRFRQADQSFTRAYGGLGLGLALVQHLVEMHGGSIKAESSGIDKGALFTVLIPTIKAVQEKIIPALSSNFREFYEELH